MTAGTAFARRLGAVLAAAALVLTTLVAAPVSADSPGYDDADTSAIYGYIWARHGCARIGGVESGVQGIACADIGRSTNQPVGRYYPYGEGFCIQNGTTVHLQCSGVVLTVELWNYTKNKRVSSATFRCGYYVNYNPRCTNNRNYWQGAGEVLGCDQAYVIVRATIRLPFTGIQKTGTAYTTNFSRC